MPILLSLVKKQVTKKFFFQQKDRYSPSRQRFFLVAEIAFIIAFFWEFS